MPGHAATALTVDGEKGLTAVEGFFLGRLYMYRQVYLHKAVRAAEAVLRALFRRLAVLGDAARYAAPARGVAPRREIDVHSYLELDDSALDCALRSWCDADDALLAELAWRLRDRRLFKTLRLRKDVPIDHARERLGWVLRDAACRPISAASIASRSTRTSRTRR